MADTIEAFVEKLKTDGVDAGQAQADEIVAAARRQADEIVQEAEKKAAAIRADAEDQAKQTLERSQSELNLAARDVLLKLRDAVQQAISSVMTKAASDKLSDADFLANMLHDLIMLYAKSDIDRSQDVEVNVSPDMQAQLADWAVHEIVRKAEEAGTTVDLRGTLSGAGFEYSVAGATIEVTPESIVEVLADMVSPNLKDVVNSADFGQDQDKRSS